MISADGLKTVIRLGLLTKAAYNQSPGLLPDGLTFVDSILGTDPDGVTLSYGIIARDEANTVYVGIRGTETLAEWWADFHAFLVPCHFAPGCKVESGFSGIYSSFRLASGGSLKTLLAGFTQRFVAGHSLGGPLATYLAAEIEADILVGFASPRPGDDAFGAYVRVHTGLILLYENVKDFVPGVPYTKLPLFAFSQVSGLLPLYPGAAVLHTEAAQHALATYLHLIDPAQPLDPEDVAPADGEAVAALAGVGAPS